MSDRPTSQGSLSSVGWIIGSLILLIFLPLILSGIEYFTVGTHRVEDFCRQVGIYDLLTRLYEPIFRLVLWLFVR